MKKDSQKRFGFLISDVVRLTSARFDEIAKPMADLTRSQGKALIYLSIHNDINQARLAELLGVTQISASRLVDRMEEKGWIERRADPVDQRAKQLHATPKAMRAAEQVREIGNQIETEALNGLSEKEKLQLLTLLRRVHENLNEMGDR
jgi:DNA-binding MarR family transcriptional regulator